MESPETKLRDRSSVPAGYALAAIAMFLLPFTGIVARLWTARPFEIAAAGVVIWILAIFAVVLAFRRVALKAGIPLPQHMVAWTVEFAALYFLSVVVTGAILKR
jgi:hypothetical protein